ncbi:MAG: hypothetical protein LBG65_07095 [Puniceicoccales bacterium]|nr:hypothetical protein [Puniceicoccales bacterium]
MPDAATANNNGMKNLGYMARIVNGQRIFFHEKLKQAPSVTLFSAQTQGKIKNGFLGK